MTCESCGDKPKKCNKDFTRTVVEIDNPEQITLMRKVTIPASMGDDTTVPPVVGKYKNVLLYYEANQKSYLYSSDGIPTLLANGLTDYEQAVNLPQINGVTLVGNKTATQLGLQDKLTAGANISIDADNVISAVDTTYGPATDSTIGLVKPGDGLEVDANGTMSISDIEQYAQFFDTVADMKAATNLVNGDYARTLGYYTINDGGGAFYKITDTQPSGYYETLSDLSYAELIIGSIANVRQFGVKGDGVANDTAKVSYIINNFDNILFPSGIYLVDTGFTVRSNQAITGEENTIIKQADSSNILNIFSGSGISNFKISNIKIDLNLDNQSYSNRSNQGRGILLTSASSNIILDKFSTNRIYGSFIYIVDSSSISIKFCNIGDPDGAYSAYGVYVVRCQHVYAKNAILVE